MNYTIMMRLLTILLTGAAFILLAKGGKLSVKAPVLIWLFHAFIYHTTVLFLCPLLNSCIGTETALILNVWSMGIRLQAILTVLIGTLYLRKVGGDPAIMLSNILSDESENEINTWLDNVLDKINLVPEGSLIGGD
jgi:hypothetical protein